MEQEGAYIERRNRTRKGVFWDKVLDPRPKKKGVKRKTFSDQLEEQIRSTKEEEKFELPNPRQALGTWEEESENVVRWFMKRRKEETKPAKPGSDNHSNNKDPERKSKQDDREAQRDGP